MAINESEAIITIVRVRASIFNALPLRLRRTQFNAQKVARFNSTLNSTLKRFSSGDHTHEGDR